MLFYETHHSWYVCTDPNMYIVVILVQQPTIFTVTQWLFQYIPAFSFETSKFVGFKMLSIFFFRVVKWCAMELIYPLSSNFPLQKHVATTAVAAATKSAFVLVALKARVLRPF